YSWASLTRISPELPKTRATILYDQEIFRADLYRSRIGVVYCPQYQGNSNQCIPFEVASIKKHILWVGLTFCSQANFSQLKSVSNNSNNKQGNQDKEEHGLGHHKK